MGRQPLRLTISVLTAAAAVIAGCTGPGPADDIRSSGAERSFGLVSVNYDQQRITPSPGLRLTSKAQFVRYTAMKRARVARLLALPLDPTRDLPAPDTCKLYDLSVDLAQEGGFAREEQGTVELVEAGELRVHTSAGTAVLAPRHFPGLLPFVSGVTYSEGRERQVDRPGRVIATSDGGDGVEAFTVTSSSPDLPRITLVGQAAPGRAVGNVGRGDALTLRWESANPTPGDVLYVEIRSGTGGSSDRVLRCRPADDGAFEIPAAKMAEATKAGAANVSLEIARQRRTLFGTDGLDQGELRVTVRDQATVQLR